MKCAKFYLVLFCTFQPTVFMAPPPQQDLSIIRRQSLDQIYNVERKLRSAVELALEGGLKKGVTRQTVKKCWDPYGRSGNDINLIPIVIECHECHNRAAQKKDIKAARKCCPKSIPALEEKAKSIRANVVACVTKYVHEAQAQRAATGGPQKGPRKGSKNPWENRISLEDCEPCGCGRIHDDDDLLGHHY